MAASRYPFPIDNHYTAVAIAVTNNKLVGESVLPTTPVMTPNFDYVVRNKEEGFTVPQDAVGRRGSPRQVTFSEFSVSAMTNTYALEDPIPYEDVNAKRSSGIPTLMDPIGDSTQYVANLLLLASEKRIADLVFDASQYPTDNKVTLSGTDQFSDYTNSNPLDRMLLVLDAPLMRPNKMVMGTEVWRKLRQHPRIVEAVKSTGAGANAQGTISQQQLADLLEIDEVIVGASRINTAKKGQTPNYGRVWGKHIAFFYQEVMGAQRGTTFGFTAQWGNREVRQIPDENIGADGGIKVRVSWKRKEVICAPDLAYFIQNAVA